MAIGFKSGPRNPGAGPGCPKTSFRPHDGKAIESQNEVMTLLIAFRERPLRTKLVCFIMRRRIDQTLFEMGSTNSEGTHVRALVIVILALSTLLAGCERKPLSTIPPPTVSHTGPLPAQSVLHTAPLVAPACAQRIVRSDNDQTLFESGDLDPQRQLVVAFRNSCHFPIRVLYETRPNGWFTESTALLQPGEASNFVGIENGFDRPGYVVCSYEKVPPSSACRLDRSE